MDDTTMDVTTWLLQGPAWVRYLTRRDLLGSAPTDKALAIDRQAMLDDPQVGTLVVALQNWQGEVMKNHKAAGHPMHKLNFVADLGLRAGDPGMDKVIEQVMAHPSPEGPFALLSNYPTVFGGSGQDEWLWALCDAPNLVSALIRFGLGDHPQVQRAVDHLTGLVQENGWRCSASPLLGKFRGPGKKEDPCPYANLVMLKALGQTESGRTSPAARSGVEAILTLWQERRDRAAYLFKMGTDFCKLKAPLVWYDLLHVLDTLSRFPACKGDPRLREMVDQLTGKMASDGRCTPESVWTAWKDWEFGQKKAPSYFITFLAHRIIKRVS
ncbi:MAG: hypothetical protein HPY76_06035 [Anaerolineae bacterium]|nr:hypothetical protein [Anaerolineae bacterium]